MITGAAADYGNFTPAPRAGRSRLRRSRRRVAREADLDHPAAARDLVGDEGRAVELRGPVRAQAAVCRAADGVFVNTDLRSEETGDEVILMATRTAGDDHPAYRELPEAADIGSQVPDQLFRFEFDEQVEAIAARELDLSPQGDRSSASMTALVISSWTGSAGKSSSIPSGAGLRGQEAASSFEIAVSPAASDPPPRGYGLSPGSRDHRGQLLLWV